MIVTEEERLDVRIKGQPLLELVGFSAFITGVTVLIWWWWRTNGIELATATPGVEPLWSVLLLDHTIVTLLAMSEFLCTLALLMGVTPLGWWLESKSLPIKHESAVTWLAGRVQAAATSVQTAANPVAAQPPAELQVVAENGQLQPVMEGQTEGVSNTAQNAAAPPQPNQAGDSNAGQQPAQQGQQAQQSEEQQQSNAQQPAQQQGPNTQIIQNQPQNGDQVSPPTPDAQAAQQQNGAGQPQQPPPTMPTSEELLADEDDEDALAGLTDVGSMLAAFQMEEEIDPWLEELSASLDHVEIDAIVSQSDEVSRQFRTGRRNNQNAEDATQEVDQRARQPVAAYANR